MSAAYFLHPGDIAFGLAGDRFETLLGSCVSVILTDPRRTAAAMCHIVHSGRASTATERSTTRLNEAFDAMYARLRASGFNPTHCEAFVYGGGNMFPDIVGTEVGQQNIDAAIERLARDRVQVIQQQVGGALYRRVSWQVGSEAPSVTAVGVQSGIATRPRPATRPQSAPGATGKRSA